MGLSEVPGLSMAFLLHISITERLDHPDAPDGLFFLYTKQQQKKQSAGSPIVPFPYQ